MTSTVADLHRVITCVDDDGGERISAFGMDRAEICGAFKPAGRPYWLIYIPPWPKRAAGRILAWSRHTFSWGTSRTPVSGLN
jgi:hypothetical protein